MQDSHKLKYVQIMDRLINIREIVQYYQTQDGTKVRAAEV